MVEDREVLPLVRLPIEGNNTGFGMPESCVSVHLLVYRNSEMSGIPVPARWEGD